MSRLVSWVSRCLAPAILLIAAIGCGRGNPLGLVPVSGRVTLDGAPLADATVSFIPEQGRPASGTTNAEGRFELTTLDPGDGVMPGDHKVTVMKYADHDAEKNPYARLVSLVPVHYVELKTTPLTVSVPKSGDSNVEITLAKK
ncbi:carboxypeptidase-like regulatory domain-containing protein [Blastopirellula sp. J2-11]|uniref:carboxypeptidase-like regulatory domain-containing protein n=1 Tax=Blastopirellula sp. J2-11 TaxID=2943192 RepID=UPI0021C6E5F8|nr:carboxypeptidase-like regulatory domain-containing protein [Blastopirellula sp. J2-11]UUO07289.1 carboxypeptidase-like regulatory domain-containing protein [Blastopirellula sp. J2-11]